MPAPRIAFFPDSFHEVNGVAHTARQFAAFAQRRQLPMLVVRAAQPAQLLPAVGSSAGSVQALDLRRSWASVPMERDLHFDTLFMRYAATVERTLHAFAPTVIHITGPSELGMLGAYYAWKLRLPLVASWHTNVHEYAGRRLRGVSRRMGSAGRALEQAAESGTLLATARFYRLARVLFAPNPTLCRLLERQTGRPCLLMQRGVDAELFSPAHRTRPALEAEAREAEVLEAEVPDVLETGTPDVPVLGFVGRFSVEKSVALLPQLAQQLAARGVHVRWVLIGHGSEEAMLRDAMPPGTVFAGVLRGAELARAYADLDLFVFPSQTDTFGNVVLEALASGVPALVTPDGGPATIVEDGVTGRIAAPHDFADAVAAMLADPARFAQMRAAARAYALRCSWDAIFEGVVGAYPAEASTTTAAA